MMNNSENHGKSSGKCEGFLARIKKVFRLPLRFKANLHADITDGKQDTSETGQVSEKKKTQHQIAVACPSKVRKRILKNLTTESKSKVSPVRAKIAQELLIELKKTGSLANFQPKSNPVRKESHIEVAKPVLEISEKPLRAKEFSPNMLGKIQAGLASVRQRLCFSIGTNHVNQPVAS